ncbi:ABC transporter ATP-binding protein [Desulfurococcaceae archaeon MEX13E-LK6-19]|nr:ABC transporter ATP-binding protein [Desulfurococcaceae archaeon MEX13E-LK6-19]
MSYAVVAEDLKKTYKTKKRKGLLRGTVERIEALRGISFKIKHGEVVGLLGPNGAGKTTTVKIIATLLLPDEGEAYVEGFSVVKEPNEVRKRIGLLLSVEKGFYGKLTGRENLEYFGALYGLGGRELKERINYLMKLLELDKLGAEDRLYEEYSLGMKARLGLARALLKDPPVLLLDEPTLGLDPPSARKIRELVKKMAREGKAILYTTHNMFEAEIVCDRILLINKGVIVAEGSPEELKARIPKLRTITVVVKNTSQDVLKEVVYKVLGDSIEPKIEVVGEKLYQLRVSIEKPEEYVGEIIRLLVEKGYDIVTMKIEEPTLEDVFIYFTR